MDDLDFNIILEVPDTPPDRLDVSRNKSRFKPHVKCFNRHDFGTSISSSNVSKDADFFFKEANRARELSKDTEPKGTVKICETIDLSGDSPCSVTNPTSYAGQLNGGSVQLDPRDKGKRVENVCNNPKGKNGLAPSSSGNSGQSNEKITIGPRHLECGQKKLVRNGCISPLNIERKKNTLKQKGKEVVVLSPQPHVCNISPDSEYIQSDERSRKITVDAIVAEKDQSVDDLSNSSRVHLTEESTSAAAGEWRTTRNRTREPKLVQDFQDLRIESGRNNGKRKVSFFHGSNEERSSSDNKTTKGSNIGSSDQVLHPRPTRRQRTQCVISPVIEVDDIQSPEVESHSARRKSQLISDEILARQLQEELYSETPTTVNTTEIDESYALWLQHHDELNAEQMRRPRVTQRRARNASSGSNLPAPPRQMSRLAFLRQEFHRSRHNMMMQMPNNNVNAGEARLTDFLNTQRDFNEDDYELLLSLDDNNHQHGGASQSQINNLPESIIQNANSEEPCTVCLEPHVIGDTVRHLPCLHKFHKDCIDAWLRRKRMCPICKSDIS